MTAAVISDTNRKTNDKCGKYKSIRILITTKLEIAENSGQETIVVSNCHA